MQATRAGMRVARPLLQQRNMSTGGGLPGALDKYVWRKSTISYITYIVVGCVAIEAVFGNVSQSIWDNANSGVSVVSMLCKSFMHVFLTSQVI
jgi:hypothetical protein